MPSKDIKQILEEEVEKFIDNSSTKELIQILPLLHESNKLITSLKQLDQDTYDPSEQVINENWKFFTDCMDRVKPLDDFKKNATLVLAKLYCVKQFSSLEFKFPEHIEDVLKFELKKYFNQLLTQDGEEFIKILFALPFEFVALVLQYVIKTSKPDFIEEVTPSQIAANEFYDYVVEIKEKTIKNINDVSLSVTNNFDFLSIKLLLEVKAFYTYNALNVGCLEYCLRLIKNKKAQTNLFEKFGQDTIEIIEAQITQHPSYIEYLKKIKNNSLQPFFLSDGTQNEQRPKPFNQFVLELFEPQDVIPLAEPADDNVVTTEPTQLELSKNQEEQSKEIDPITGEPLS